MRESIKTPSVAPVTIPALTVGLDVADKYTIICGIDAQGEIVERSRIRTTPAGVEGRFRGVERCRVVLEVGAHSPWLSRLLKDCGHEVIVAHTRKVRAISDNPSKSDDVDAEMLARLGRVDPKLLSPIQHRGPEAQAHLAVLRARDTLVRSRTLLVNHVRGVIKSSGSRIKKCSTESFARQADDDVPESLREALAPMLKLIESLTEEIRRYDRRVEQIANKSYPETELLRNVRGVGALTALAYVLVIEDPKRFKKSRMVGAFLGLRPRRAQSGDKDPQRRITKMGDRMLRRLLVGSAHYILGPFGEDCDMRRWGLKLCERGGKNAKKRAIVAVARKLAVLLHHMWTTGIVYEPLHKASREEPATSVKKHETVKPGRKRALARA